MASYGIVAGKNVVLAANTIQKADKTIKITKRWEFVDDVALELTTNPPAIIDNLKSIIVVDSGFKNASDPEVMAKDFVILQDAFQSRGLSNVKLNLITANADLKKKLEGSIEGIDGIYYINVEVFLLKTKLTNQVLAGLYKGKYDHTGLFNKNILKQNLENRLEKEKNTMVNDARRISNDVLHYGEDVPINEMNQEEYLDSEVTQKKVEQREKEARRKERSKKKPSKPEPKEEPDFDDDLDTDDLEIDFNTTPPAKDEPKARKNKSVEFSDDYIKTTGAPISKPNVDFHANVNREIPTTAEIHELFRRLDSTSDDTLESKLKSDESVISVVGPHNAGGSGFVAQSADMYAMLGRRVLIIDLDIEKRSQTLYFPSYDESVKNHKGNNNSLIKASQGVAVTDTAVPVTSRIDILSISRQIENISIDFSATVASEFSNIIREAKESYDIVLIDLPLRLLSYYVRHLDVVDRNIFIVENKFYTVEDFFSIELNDILGDDDFFGIDLLRKSSLVLNKFIRTNMDYDGYQISKYKVKEKLIAAGDPYDNILVAGEIPYYKDWETQFITQVRYLWQDDLSIGLYRKIFSKIV